MVKLLSRSPRNYSDADPIRFYCEQLSPDNSLKCTDELGHLGWCVSGDTSWSAGAWNVDHWADTPLGPPIDPEPTMDARDWSALNETRLVQSEPPPATPSKQPKQPKQPRSKSTGDCSRCHVQHRSCSCPRSETPDDSWTHHELKMAARQRGITYYYRFSKKELIKLLNDPRQPTPKQPEPPKMSAQEWKALKVTGWCDSCRDWRKHCTCTGWCNTCKDLRRRCRCETPKPQHARSTQKPKQVRAPQTAAPAPKYKGWCQCGAWRQTCGCAARKAATGSASQSLTHPVVDTAPPRPQSPQPITRSSAPELPELDPISRMQDWLADNPAVARLAINALVWGGSLAYLFTVAR